MIPSRILLSFEVGNSYQRGILKGIIRFINETGLLSPVEYQGYPFMKPTRVPHTPADGLIGVANPKLIRQTDYWKDKPVICTINQSGDPPWATVCSDDWMVGDMAANYLMRLGLRHLACVGCWDLFPHSVCRSKGFSDACVQRGRECLVYHAPESDSSMFFGGDYSSLTEWIKNLPLPCGLYCVNDRLATKVFSLLQKLNIRTPDDMALLGTDNDVLALDLLDRSISSVELNTDRIGYEAGRILSDHLHQGIPLPAKILIPPIRIVPRSSTEIRYHADPLIPKIYRRLEESPEAPKTVDEILEGIGVSRRVAERVFRKETGTTIYESLIGLRINLAKNLLRETTLPMGEIAYQSGFCDQRQFSLMFRKRTGLTPTGFRRG